MSDRHEQWLGRRAFLKGSTLFLAGSAFLPGDLLAATEEKPKLRLGLVTDLHYAEKEPTIGRYYRESLTKLAEAAKQFDKEKPDLVVELGDLIDGTDSVDVEKGYLRRIIREFPGKCHFVLGNHCVYSLTKPEFLGTIGQEKSFYSFDANGYHFVVLDACFRADGQPYGRRNFQWLQADLMKTACKTVVFVHQRLDAEPPYGVKNAPEIRKILEASGKVLAVLQGHHHKGDYKELGGIHYCTVKAMIEGPGPENNAYAMMDLLPGDAIRIRGFRKQKSYRW